MEIVVEGTVNSDVCGRGERRTVEWTEQLQGYLNSGLLVVVEPAGQAAVVPEVPSVGVSVIEPAATVVEDAAVQAVAEAGPPPRTGKGATVQAWRDWLTGQGIEFDPHCSRDDLIAHWDAGQV